MTVQHLTDDEIRYWIRYHVTRTAKDVARIADLRAPRSDDLRSEWYIESGIESCEVSIRHSERNLAELHAEAEHRGIEVEA